MEDLLTLLESALGESEKGSVGNARFKCPIKGCTSVRKRLEVSIEKDSDGNNPWQCWVCKERGLSIKSLFRKAKVDQKYFSRLNNIFFTRESSKVHSDYLSLPPEFKTFDNLKQSDFVGRKCLAEIKKRGLTEDHIIKYQLGYCDSGKYRNRIIIPSFDSDGYLNFFTARTIIDDEEQRYLNPDTERSNIIPFELYINWNAPIILCEGFFDAMAISRNAVPILEKGITVALMSKILESKVKKIYIALDKDAMKEALEYADKFMSNGKKVYLLDLDQKDPSDMKFSGFTTLAQKAKALTRETLLMRRMLYNLQ